LFAISEDSESRFHDPPLVSVAIETYNADSGAEIELAQVLGQLRAQTYPQEKIEVILVIDEDNVRLTRAIEEQFPWTRIVHVKESTYYGMKVHGMKAGEGDIVALTDADCALRGDYVENLVRNFQNGADDVVGKVRFTPGARFAKTFNLFCFAYIRADKNGFAQAFSVNSVAFSKEVAHRYSFDPRIQRSGGAYLLARQLCAAGYKIVYDPEIAVVHDAYDLRFQMLMRVRSGYEVVYLSQLDEDGVLPETKFRRLGILAPLFSSAFRFLFDLKIIASDRRDLDISIPEIPYFIVASIVIRSIETAAGVLTIFKPNYLADRYGW